MYTLKYPSTQIRAYFDFKIEEAPHPLQESITHPADNTTRRLKFLEQQVRDGSATPGQKAMLESLKGDSFAPEQVHYLRGLVGDGKDLTKGQKAYLNSYESNPRAPQAIHYFAQLEAEGVNLNPEQQKIKKTYEESRMPEEKPPIPKFPL